MTDEEYAQIHNPAGLSQIFPLLLLCLEDNVAMRRGVFMAGLSAALLVVPLWGQRGGHGGMAGGGGRGVVVGAPRGGGVYGGGASHGAYGNRVIVTSGRYPSHSGRIRFCFGCNPWRWGWGWSPLASWGWSGGLGWSSAFDSSPQADPTNVYPSPDNTSAIIVDNQQRQIDRLDEEVARLRAERESDAARNSIPQPPPKAQILAKTVILYRNHHIEEIENYAIVGQTLWVFTEQRARKIPIAELDLPATINANDVRGIDFQLPTQQEKQESR